MDSTGIKGGEIGGVADIPLPEKSLEGEGMLDGRDFAGRQSQGVREVQEDSYGVVMASEFGGGVRDLFVLVAATDGIETLTGGEIAEVVVGQANRGALEIAEALLAAVAAKKMPRQDNTTVVVVRISG